MAKKQDTPENSSGIDLKAREQLLKSINNRFGNDIVVFGNKVKQQKLDSISTGSISLDSKIGIGGIPIGKVTELSGAQSSSKTTMCIHIVANAQKKFPNKLAAYIDGEHELDRKYAENLGMSFTEDKLWFSQPDCLEDALDLLVQLVASNMFSVVIFDSLAALPPKIELEGSVEDRHTAIRARPINSAMRRINTYVDKVQTAIVFVDQLRDNVSFFGSSSGKVTTGGNAMKFRNAVSIRLSLLKTNSISEGGEVMASRIKAKLTKNKVGIPLREAEFDVVFGKGIDKNIDIVNVGIETGVLVKKGSWISYNNETIGQGVLKTATLFSENTNLRDEIENKIIKVLETGILDDEELEEIEVETINDQYEKALEQYDEDIPEMVADNSQTLNSTEKEPVVDDF